MKKNKKVVMALSFCLGATMFVTTAFADVASKTGYDQLKDAVKYTAEAGSEKLQSLTLEGTVTLKDNGKVLFTSSSTQKIDNAKAMREEFSSTEYTDGDKKDAYNYSDTKSSIWYSPDNDTYYVTEFVGENKSNPINNPFKEDRIKDMEKIFDALVGNLKDYVVVNEKADGTKELSGSLNESQIPALINAITSFGFKQAFSGNNGSPESKLMPQMLDDVFVKNVTGKAIVNKDGVIESIFATGVLSGNDKNGQVHDLTIELLGKVYDINSTSVAAPDLTGKKVEKTSEKAPGQMEITKKYIGTYKNDIVIEKDDSFVKIGERVVEIVGIDDKHISGRYYETYKDGYAEYSADKKDFRFDAEIKDGYYADFKYADASGRTQSGSMSVDQMTGRIYFNIANESKYDSSFSRFFEE